MSRPTNKEIRKYFEVIETGFSKEFGLLLLDRLEEAEKELEHKEDEIMDLIQYGEEG